MKFNKNEFGWKEKVSVNTDELATKNDIPHYNEILITEISGDDYRFLRNNNYFNMSALNIDETKLYVGKDIDITNDEEYTFKFVYDKEADALMGESFVYIYNHKSYNGENFVEDVDSAVLTFFITPMISEFKGEGYFKLYKVDKLELDTNCLPDNVSIPNSLTVGNQTGDIADFSGAEGDEITASGSCSHAEGAYTIASGNISHAEGGYTTASGNFSHAEGNNTIANGEGSHAEGNFTIASSDYQHVQGKYNIEDTENKYAHIVGNGMADTARSNAHTLDWKGNAWFAGKVTVGTAPTENMDVATKKYVDDSIANQPQISFNDSGELVVTINGVSKTFVPKQ